MKFKKLHQFLLISTLAAAFLAGCGSQEPAAESSGTTDTAKATVGTFTTEDIFGETYTEAIFAENEMTFVNVFTTWCPPCIQEMPELEALRQEFEDTDTPVGIVGIVLDAKEDGVVVESAIEQAKLLKENSGARFPYLIPDEGLMNGRLSGIDAIPESFFVDQEGNIVSEAYVGSNDLEGWREVVMEELAKLRGEG